MPKQIVETIHAAMNRVLESPTVRDRLKRLGMEPGTMTLDELAQLLKTDYEAAGALVKVSGAHVQ